jgi:hypothetical protein
MPDKTTHVEQDIRASVAKIWRYAAVNRLRAAVQTLPLDPGQRHDR